MTSPFRCPVCNGAGKVSRPPWVAGDVETWLDAGTGLYDCRPCGGSGIVWGPPPDVVYRAEAPPIISPLDTLQPVEE